MGEFREQLGEYFRHVREQCGEIDEQDSCTALNRVLSLHAAAVERARKMEERVDGLRRDLDAVRDQNDRREADLQEAFKQRDTLKDRLDLVKMEYGELKSERDTLAAQLDAMTRERDGIAARCNAFNDQVNALTAQLAVKVQAALALAACVHRVLAGYVHPKVRELLADAVNAFDKALSDPVEGAPDGIARSCADVGCDCAKPIICPTCSGTKHLLSIYARPGGPPGNGWLDCPTCCTAPTAYTGPERRVGDKPIGWLNGDAMNVYARGPERSLHADGRKGRA
jgi:FtsZ-binding cell division protein ZapB